MESESLLNRFARIFQDQPYKAGFVLAAIFACIGLLMHTIHFRTLTSLSENLGRSLGIPVKISSIKMNFPRSIVFKKIHIGDSFDADSLELQVSLGKKWRPNIDRILIVGPSIRFALNDKKSTEKESPKIVRGLATNTIQKSPRKFWRSQLPKLIVQNGTVDLTLNTIGQKTRLFATGINLKPEQNKQRLVVGHTEIFWNHKRLTNLNMLSADLDLAKNLYPKRAACLGGQIFLPFSYPVAFNLLIAQLDSVVDGYNLSLQLQPIDRNAGRLSAVAQLTPMGQPKDLRIKIQDIKLNMLAPFFDEAAGMQVNNASLSGLFAATKKRDAYEIRAILRGHKIILNHSAIADSAIGPFDGQIKAFGSLSSNLNDFELTKFDITSGKLNATILGKWEKLVDGSRMSFKLKIPKTPCHEVLQNLPQGFAPKLYGMALTGSIGLNAYLHLDTRNLEKTKISLLWNPLSCKVLKDPPNADVTKLLEPTTISVMGANGEQKPFVLGPTNKNWQPLTKISRHLYAAFIAAEDNNFYRHNGFDQKQLLNAFIENLKTKKLRRGASTISQQLVKNVFLNNKRDFSRKIQEAVLTWRLEQVLSKQRILELYLNMVEMGPGIHGVEQASQYFFKTNAAQVSPLQAVHLAALTPSPRPLALQFKERSPSIAWKNRLAFLLKLMQRNGSLSQTEQKHWESEELKFAHQ